MKIATVNVIELTNGEFCSIRSFTDNEEGNNEAETLFAQLLKEFDPNDMTEEDIDVCLEEGIYEVANYQVIITHSN